jgi:hypothetical protein
MSGKNFGFSGFKLSSSSNSNKSADLKAKYPVETTSNKPIYGSSFSKHHKTEEE